MAGGPWPRRSAAGGVFAACGRPAELTASELTRLAGSPDHQGVVAEVDPYPYADPDSLLDRPDALVVALDQVQDPRNLGAVCRSAEAVGAAGVVIPSRRSAAVTAVACKASAGAVEHLPVARVSNLADWLTPGQGLRRLDLRGGAGCPDALRAGRPERQARARAGQRGEGAPPPCLRQLRPVDLDPRPRTRRVAERVRRRGGAPVRGGQTAGRHVGPPGADGASSARGWNRLGPARTGRFGVALATNRAPRGRVG